MKEFVREFAKNWKIMHIASSMSHNIRTGKQDIDSSLLSVLLMWTCLKVFWPPVM